MSFFSRLLSIGLLFSLTTLSACHTADDFGNQTERLINHSRVTFQSMVSDAQYPGLMDLTSRAKAVIIIPSMFRGAFIFGGRGGNAVMLVRDENNQWSYPAFYTLGGISFGLQAGANTSEMVITVMSERGVNAILSRQATLGGDAGLAVGELGSGVNAATGIGYKADMYAFARSEGLYAGVSLEGSVISPRHTWNKAFYGPDTSPQSILLDKVVSTGSPAASAIVAAMP